MVSKNDDIFSVLAKKHGLHRNIIAVVCNHPFMFASKKIADPDDEKSIMFAYLFKLKLKKAYKGKKKQFYERQQEKKNIRKQGDKCI